MRIVRKRGIEWDPLKFREVAVVDYFQLNICVFVKILIHYEDINDRVVLLFHLAIPLSYEKNCVKNVEIRKYYNILRFFMVDVKPYKLSY